MDADTLAALLALPPASRVDRRIPKTLLTEHGATTAADRRLISAGIETLHWVAALKPATCGIPAYRDAEREYAELHVLRLESRTATVSDRLRLLVHRAIPYPVLLLSVATSGAALSSAAIRWSLGEANRTVLDGSVDVAPLPTGTKRPEWWGDAEQALALTEQRTRDLRTLHEDWTEVLVAVRAAWQVHRFRRLGDAAGLPDRRAALDQTARLEAEMVRLRASAKRTPQRSRQVALTAELRRLEREHRGTLGRI